MRTAFLIDGGFFLQRVKRLQGPKTPQETARSLHWMCREHLRVENRDLKRMYRILYYDCPPLTKKEFNPISRQVIDFSQTPTAIWRSQFLEELKKLRKVALRLGYLNDRTSRWALRPEVLKRLLAGNLTVAGLKREDVVYDARQKGVDMRIELDIASLAYKRQVDQIVLVAGDSDFVPAAKLARREGIDFILDPMWTPIREDLHEHIDGLKSVLPRPQKQPVLFPVDEDLGAGASEDGELTAPSPDSSRPGKGPRP